jgi:DNA-binding transcriptional ArsR family regulator
MAVVHELETALSAPPVEVVSGTAFTALLALARAAARPRADVPGELRVPLERAGDSVGELWLNLLGVPLDAGPPYSVERLVSTLATIDPVELRRHALGRYAWTWCTLAGVDVIDAAAAGDSTAFPRLSEHPRYYGGRAAESLSTLLPLDPEETRRRIAAAVEVAVRTLVEPERSAAGTLESAARAATALVATRRPLDAIERLTGGYRYVPEPEADRVILVPHLELTPRLLLAQHRGARVISYSVAVEDRTEERVVALGKALADAKRIEILALLARGHGQVPELVEATGLSRSTVHHHLAHLREVGLVVFEGNARAYTYRARWEGVDETASLLAELIGSRPA